MSSLQLELHLGEERSHMEPNSASSRDEKQWPSWHRPRTRMFRRLCEWVHCHDRAPNCRHSTIKDICSKCLPSDASEYRSRTLQWQSDRWSWCTKHSVFWQFCGLRSWRMTVLASCHPLVILYPSWTTLANQSTSSSSFLHCYQSVEACEGSSVLIFQFSHINWCLLSAWG